MTWHITLAPQTTYVTDPTSPCAGQPFTVKWQETNAGDEPSQAYTDTFEMNYSGKSQSQDLPVSDPLAPGAVADRELTFTLPDPGTYNMNLTINGQPGYLGDVIVADCSAQ
jgi:hypothetical protein